MNVEKIANLPTEELQTWVQSALAGETESGADINRVGLAEVLASEVRSNENVRKKIQLAELAVTIHEWLSE